MRGKHQSEEVKQKRGIYRVGKDNPCSGKPFTVKHCLNLSLAKQKYFETHSAHNKGFKTSDRTKELQSLSKRRLYQQRHEMSTLAHPSSVNPQDLYSVVQNMHKEAVSF
jgi:hypothetical protein